ncbi:MAG: hypothetical protein IPM74_18135 [Crocinitomicaceae bacterium]|nr:hypothetical protein [Crocinitomicaceae bacterium]MBK8927762.1 hypothetical protein [Crocinitomicaceae bacterium]
MKSINLWTCFVVSAFFALSCNGNKKSESATEASTETTAVNLLTGTWMLDSSLYFEDKRLTTVAPPVMPTTWEFAEDGKYTVKNSLTLAGTYQRTTDSVYVILLDVPNSYEIISLTDANLRLRATIVGTDEMSLQTDACLTRKKD